MSGAATGLAAGETLPIDQFGQGPIWLTVIKVVMVFAFLVVMTLFTIVYERKLVGRMQNRIGPNRTGPWGTLQSLADGVKLAFKEEIVPLLADKKVYFIAPILSAVPAFLAWSVIPFGPVVSMFGHRTPLQLTDLPVGVLVILSSSALGVYGLILSGWASGSTYPLLGSLRSAAQVISYEVAMGLSLVSVFLLAHTMSTSGIVEYQRHNLWMAIPLIVPFAIYCIAIVGETNRAPFDLPEAESELVGGFHTEYSSFKFAMFFLAEYINMVTVSALGATLFLGGWRAPWPISLWAGANSGWWPVLWFVGKIVVFLSIFVWLRGTLPRLRYDQFMSLGWKWLIPINLLWIMAVATVQTLKFRGTPWYVTGLVLAVPLVIIVISATLAYETAQARKKAVGEADDLEEARLGPAFPTPPLDLRVPAAARSTRSPTAGLTREQRRKALAGGGRGDDTADSIDDTSDEV